MNTLQMTLRAVSEVIGIMAAAVITNNDYYPSVLQSLTRLEALAHASVPAILALLLVYTLIQKSR